MGLTYEDMTSAELADEVTMSGTLTFEGCVFSYDLERIDRATHQLTGIEFIRFANDASIYIDDEFIQELIGGEAVTSSEELYGVNSPEATKARELRQVAIEMEAARDLLEWADVAWIDDESPEDFDLILDTPGKNQARKLVEGFLTMKDLWGHLKDTIRLDFNTEELQAEQLDGKTLG